MARFPGFQQLYCYLIFWCRVSPSRKRGTSELILPCFGGQFPKHVGYFVHSQQGLSGRVLSGDGFGCT